MVKVSKSIFILAGAISVHHTATVDKPWDGPAAVAAMPNSSSALTYCHAWKDTADGADPDAKSSYKMPHHQADHAPANVNGVRNALARLSGANIPEGDKAAVKAHLQAHLDDFNAKDTAVNRARSWMTNFTRPPHTHPPKGDSWQDQLDAYRARKAANPQAFGLRIVRNDGGLAVAQGVDMYLYDEIGYWGITASDFIGELSQLQGANISLHVNSPGGDVFDGIAIYNALLNHQGMVAVTIDSLAASAASFIAMAGQQVQMAKTAQIMIHDALALVIGNAQELRDTADLLDKNSLNIASIYADRAGGTPEDWRTRMMAETWYSSDEALDAGLVDAIQTPPARNQPAAPVQARKRPDMSMIDVVPLPQAAVATDVVEAVAPAADLLSDEQWEALKGAFR